MRSPGTLSVTIVPPAECYFEGMHRVLDMVAREKRYLAFLQAPPIAEAYSFYRNILDNDLCQVIAVQDSVVVGWCDILPTHGEARKHVGTLGMAVAPPFRHQGIGTMLIGAAIARAWEKGLCRIELSVRTDNSPAKRLYEKFGFAVDGLHRKAFLVDDQFYDTYAMALLR